MNKSFMAPFVEKPAFNLKKSVCHCIIRKNLFQRPKAADRRSRIPRKNKGGKEK